MSDIYDLAILGGGPAGITAAIYASRARLNTIWIDKNFAPGGQVTATYAVDNYPGMPGISGMDLGEAFGAHARKLGLEPQREKILSLENISGEIKTIRTKKHEYQAKALILAFGAEHRKLDIPGEDDLSGLGVSYCATCDGAFFKDKNVAVVGGGNTALDDALVLSFTSKKVYLIHRSDTFSGEKRLLEKLQEHDNVVFILDSEVTAINGSERLESLGIRNKVSGEEQTLDVDAVFIAIGHVPDNKAFASLVELDAYGYIKTDENCATSCPGIYAAGDGRVKKVRQLTTAAADGTEAALAACDYIDLL